MWWLTLEAYLESNATSTVELFSKTVNSFKLFDLLLNVRLSFRYAYEYYNNFFPWRFHFNPLATGGGGSVGSRSVCFCCFFTFAKFLQGVAPIWIPHFRRPFSPSVRFNFPVLHFRENGGWGPPDSPSVVLRWNFLKHCFLKNSYKRLLRHFLYMFVFTHPQAPFRQLGPSFLGWKSK